jgi:hypothetical protein
VPPEHPDLENRAMPPKQPQKKKPKKKKKSTPINEATVSAFLARLSVDPDQLDEFFKTEKSPAEYLKAHVDKMSPKKKKIVAGCKVAQINEEARKEQKGAVRFTFTSTGTYAMGAEEDR